MAMKLSRKLLAAMLCIVVALLILTSVSAQYGFGSPGSCSGNFNPLAYFRPVSIGGGPGFPGFGLDPFNPFVYGSVWNPVSFLGPRNIGPVSYPARPDNVSKDNETESKGDEKSLKSLKAML
jgi:hypothetical protein